MSDMFARFINIMPAIPANAENPAAALGLEILFFAIVLFTLALSIGAIVRGFYLAVQQVRENLHTRWERRHLGAKPT